MPRCKLVVLTRPVEGREDEYNDWYQNTHLADIVSVSGFKSAQRFRLFQPMMEGGETYPYLAIYDIETDDIEASLRELTERARGQALFVSPALDMNLYAAVYEELGPKVAS